MKNSTPLIHPVSTKKEKIICAEILVNTEAWITLGMDMDVVMSIINDNLNEVFVVYIKGELVGTIIIQTKGAFTGYLKSIAIKPDFRGMHLGQFMMKFVENHILSNSQNVFLCVSSFNTKAKKFYLKLGYKIIGVLKNYIAEGHDEILMRKTIGPILKNTDLY
jgi:ribosomal protein S18 acetylase RimI-like enzyme